MKDSDQQVYDDFEYSRKVYMDLINVGQEALQDMLGVADETQHPRSYEVLSGMIKNISDVNDKLMDIHKKKKDITSTEKNKQLPNNTTNNLFVGSTTDLQRFLLQNSEIDNEKIIDINDYSKNND